MLKTRNKNSNKKFVRRKACCFEEGMGPIAHCYLSFITELKHINDIIKILYGELFFLTAVSEFCSVGALLLMIYIFFLVQIIFPEI